MPADNKKEKLRSLLAGKTIEELEELLALDFTEEKTEVDADYISAILEVIEEREQDKEITDTETAWEEFQEYYKLSKEEKLEAGRTESPNLDHHHKTEQCQKPRKTFKLIRNAAVAAVLVSLLCSTAMGWNLFQIIAEWTEETFQFLTRQGQNELPEVEALVHLQQAVADYTDIPCVPQRAPERTQEKGNLWINEQSSRCSIGMGFTADGRMFTIYVFIHDSFPDSYSSMYQKDVTIHEEYVVNGISHYLTRNNDSLSAMWTNQNIEGHIQGELTLEEMKQMIDSIYKE